MARVDDVELAWGLKTGPETVAAVWGQAGTHAGVGDLDPTAAAEKRVKTAWFLGTNISRP